jgi:hypothetical protein
VRLIHLSRARKHVLDVDVPRGPAETPAGTNEDAETEQHVTTEQLKHQFEERLAARTRHRRTKS